jgi:hypothetical protein
MKIKIVKKATNMKPSAYWFLDERADEQVTDATCARTILPSTV